jgi:hypothetical protein
MEHLAERRHRHRLGQVDVEPGLFTLLAIAAAAPSAQRSDEDAAFRPPLPNPARHLVCRKRMQQEDLKAKNPAGRQPGGVFHLLHIN